MSLARFLAAFGAMLAGFAALAVAQDLPPVGVIDIYGVRGRVKEEDVRKALTNKIGDEARAAMLAKDDNEKRLEAIPGVADASVSIVCCDEGGKTMIFAGVKEVGQSSLTFRTAPTGSVRLTNDIILTGKQFDEAFLAAAGNGNTKEDDSQGHALFAEPKVRVIQERFPSIADANLELLRKVIRESSDAKQRALAAEIIAYSKDKKAVVGDILFAIDDPDLTVRNNATRALIVIANYARSKPELGITINGSPFVRMLNSIDWTDRNKAIGVLFAITATPDAKLLDDLKKNALPSLREMALWKNPGHSLSAFVVLGRLAGLKREEILATWQSPDRKTSVETMLGKISSVK